MTETLKKTEYEFPAPLPIQPEELEVLSPRDRVSVADWAVTKRKLSSKTTNFDGDWSHDYTPYAVPIMEWLSDAGTRQVNIMACAQSGKTEIGLNFLGHTIDEDPAPFLMVMPRETDASRRVGTRIKPMFESTPSLQKHLPRMSLDEINIGKETLLDNMNLYLAWAGSPAAMADNPICKGHIDEAAKFPRKVKNEADAINLIKKRFTTYRGRSKLLNTSTPATKGDPFDREFESGTKFFWHAKCSHCGEFHFQKWEHYQLDKDKQGKLLSATEYHAGGHARYVCPECGVCWTEQDRWAAVSAGKMVPEGCTIDKTGRISGKIPVTAYKSTRITAFMLYPGWMTADILAAEWAEAQLAKHAGDIEPLQDFINSRCGEPWEEKEKETDEIKLRSHIGTYEPGIIPAGVQLLTAGFDVQLDHIWGRVLGWGYLSEVWSIYEERFETGDTSLLENYQLLREFLSMTWPLDEDPDKHMTIRMAGIDCNYRTDVVYDFCRLCKEVDILPVRGDDSVKTRVYRPSKIAGGTMIRYDINIGVIKDRLFRLLFESAVPGPGYFHLHRDTTDEVLQHLSSEDSQPIRKGKKVERIWVKKGRHVPNHLWDCDVYGTFVAELAGARTLRDPTVPVKKRQRRVGKVQR